jgi:hypothetical protein
MAVSSVGVSSQVQRNENQSIGSSRGQKRFYPESSAHNVLQTKARKTLRMNSRPSRMYSKSYQERKSSADPLKTGTAPQASMHFPSHEPVAHPVIKLLGVFMAPHVQTISCDSNDLVKSPGAHQADSYSTVKAGMDSRDYDFLLVSHKPLDPSTSSPTKTSLVNLSINNESPARTLANQSEDTVHRDSNNKFKIQYELTKIRFDKELFKNLDYFLGIFHLLSKKEELVMSESEFIAYHKEFSDRLKVATENLAKHSLESDNSELNRNFGKSVAQFLRYQDLWYIHWKRLADFEFTPCIQKIENFKSLRTRRLVTVYLFYVEMINQVVPIPKTEATFDSNMKEAFMFIETLLIPVNTRGGTTKAPFEKERLSLQKKLKVYGPRNFFSCLWSVLEMWIKNCRKGLFDAMLMEKVSFLTVKFFFNQLFSYSAVKLSLRLKN